MISLSNVLACWVSDDIGSYDYLKNIDHVIPYISLMTNCQKFHFPEFKFILIENVRPQTCSLRIPVFYIYSQYGTSFFGGSFSERK